MGVCNVFFQDKNSQCFQIQYLALLKLLWNKTYVWRNIEKKRNREGEKSIIKSWKEIRITQLNVKPPRKLQPQQPPPPNWLGKRKKHCERKYMIQVSILTEFKKCSNAGALTLILMNAKLVWTCLVLRSMYGAVNINYCNVIFLENTTKLYFLKSSSFFPPRKKHIGGWTNLVCIVRKRASHFIVVLP